MIIKVTLVSRLLKKRRNWRKKS